MGKKLHFDNAAEKEATDIGARFMHSSDVVGDMSRAYGRDLSSVRIHTDDSAARGAAERGVDAFSTGRDVFFARGAFDQGDPASRGLLAHELSHSLQQGVGGEMALAQSAPMGAAQGGILDWFKGLFGQPGGGEDAAPGPEPAAPAQAAPEADAQPELALNNDPQKELSDMAETLHSSRKWGLHNSDRFTRVSTAISSALVSLRWPLSGDPAQDQDTLTEIIGSFDELISACDDYLSRDPSTSRGMHRQDIVRQVRELAVKDRFGFYRYMVTPGEGERFTSATDVLTRSRQRTLQLVNGREEDLQHVGNAASYIAKIEPGMLTDRNASGFFKQEETFTRRMFSLKQIWRDGLESAKQKISLPEEQYREIEAVIERKEHLREPEADLPDYNSNRKLHEAVSMINHFVSAYQTKDSNLPNPLKDGESLSLSKRNVATSRLAGLLGVGDLVAGSETATLVDADGTSRSGNLMQAAEGQEVLGFVVDQLHEEYGNKRRDSASISDISLNANMDDKITPEFMKSLMALQVLDNLAAQEDRHAGNFFAQVRDGKLGKVQAIDNDFSFSNRSLRWEDGTRSIGTHGLNILDTNGELNIPYMDRALADHITALNEQVLRDFMADVLEPWAIDALCVRFNQVKTAVQKALEKTPDHFLEQDSDWASPEVSSAVRNGYEDIRRPGFGQARSATNYVSNLLMSADLSPRDIEFRSAMNFRSYLETDYYDRLCDGVLLEVQSMDGPEQAKAHLKAYGVTDGIISYLETTGQLFDGPALFKRLPDAELKNIIKGTIMDLEERKGQPA